MHEGGEYFTHPPVSSAGHVFRGKSFSRMLLWMTFLVQLAIVSKSEKVRYRMLAYFGVLAM